MTAATLIIDASALVKLLVREPDSGYYETCVGDETRLIAPAHILAETGEVLSRKMRAGHVDARQLARIVEQLRAEIVLIDLLDLFERAWPLRSGLTPACTTASTSRPPNGSTPGF